MMHIDDDVFNRYLDAEMRPDELREFNQHISECTECRIKLKATNALEGRLRSLKQTATSAEFTRDLMDRIPVQKGYIGKNYFFRVLLSFVLLIIAVIVGFVFVNVISAAGQGGSKSLWDSIVSFSISSGLAAYHDFLRSRSVSVVGSALTVILFISWFFLVDSHRRTKDKLKRFS